MKNWWIFALGIVALSCCLIGMCLSLVFGLGLWNDLNFSELFTTSVPDLKSLAETATQLAFSLPATQPVQTDEPDPTETPLASETLTDTPTATLTSIPQATRTETPLPEPVDTLSVLENTLVPINNLLELADRLEGRSNLPVSLTTAPEILSLGAKDTFWITDSETNENYEISATLRYITEHVYFWIQDGVEYEANALRNLVETFERQIYPTNREFFGSEWRPGVDNDPHLYILYVRTLGGSVAGYFSPADEYLPLVREDSNGHEMFLMSARHANLGKEYAYSILAHEFQHMIHWYRDRNEESWVNEGFAELAAFLNGYSVGGHDYLYASDPDIQLTDWPANPTERSSHYGSSFLFMTYFLDRFGEQATQALVADPDNGMNSIDEVLAALQINDPLTGQIVQADQVFRDWVIASYLQNSSVGDGRYTYHNYPDAPQPFATEDIRSCPQKSDWRQVSQYGVDYIRIRCRGSYTLHFEGTQQVKVLPTDPFSGSYVFYSNRGDESDMTLTRTFDFTNHTGPLTLSYWTWYDIEKDWDYLYLLASVDGENWQFLFSPSGTAEDPTGNSYGWGLTGFSGDGPTWIQESVDISQFAGKQVQIRFEYITDSAVNGEGFLVDDIAIPEIGYFTDFETDDGGWQANGFVRIQNSLPQVFQLSLISINSAGIGSTTTVTSIVLSAENSVEIPLILGNDVSEVILVVSGLTRFTRQLAEYQYSLSP